MRMAKKLTVPAAEHDEGHVKEVEVVNERSHSKMQGVRGELWKPGRVF